MYSLSGYSLDEELHVSHRTAVYRGRDIANNRSVIIKFLIPEYLTSKELAALQHEYEIMRSIDSDGVIHAFGVEKNALILEDSDGVKF